MTDLLVASLACDLTRVATMQWADSEAKFIMNFAPLNMPDHHHAYQHEKGFFSPTRFQDLPMVRDELRVPPAEARLGHRERRHDPARQHLVFWVSEIQNAE